MKLSELQSSVRSTPGLAGKIVYLTSLGEITAEPYFGEVMLGMTQASIDSGLSPEHLMQIEVEPSKFHDAIQYLVGENIKGLFLSSDLDEKTADCINHNIQNKKLCVISVDTDAPNIDRLYCIGSNNADIGIALARQFVKDTKAVSQWSKAGLHKFIGKLGVPGGVGIIVIGDKTCHEERAQAIRQILRKEFPWLVVHTIVETAAGWCVSPKGNREFIDLSTAIAHVSQGKVVFGVFAPRAPGIAEAHRAIKDLAAHQVPLRRIKNASIYGTDLTEQTASHLEDGHARGTVIQSPGLMGYLAQLIMMHAKRQPDAIEQNSRKALIEIVSQHFVDHPGAKDTLIGKQLSVMLTGVESISSQKKLPIVYTPVTHIDGRHISSHLFSLLTYTRGSFLKAATHLGAQHAALSITNTELESQKKVLQEQARTLEQYGMVEGLYLYTKNIKGEFTSVSPQTVKLLGAKDKNEILGKTDADLQFLNVDPQHLSQHLSKLRAQVAQREEDERQVLSEGIPILKVEETLDPVSGRVKYLRTMKLPVKNASGVITGLNGINMDVTQLMRLQNSMIASYEGMPDSVLTSVVQYSEDRLPQAVIETANKSARYQLHIHDGNPKGKTSESLFLPAHVQKNERNFLLKKENQIDTPEIFMVHSQRRCYLTSRIITVMDSTGRPLEYLTYHKDVTALVTSVIAMNEAAQQIASTSEELAISTKGLHQTNLSMESLVHEVSSSAQRTREFMSEFMKDIELISDGFNIQSDNIRTKIQEQTQQVSESIYRQNDASVQIEGFVEVLEEFVDRTSILTLNAAIAAAAAGSQGKGFAVIAEEIRNLSSRSKFSLTEIQQQMCQIALTNEELNTTLDTVLRSLQDIISDVFTTLKRNLEKPIRSAVTVSENMDALATHAEKAANGIVQVGVSTNEMSKTAQFLSKTADNLLVITVDHIDEFMKLLRDV